MRIKGNLILLIYIFIISSNYIDNLDIDDIPEFDLDHPDFYISKDKTEYIKEYWKKKEKF